MSHALFAKRRSIVCWSSTSAYFCLQRRRALIVTDSDVEASVLDERRWSLDYCGFSGSETR